MAEPLQKSGFEGPKRPVRLDKWLWAVRLYKTRALSKKACESGKVRIDGVAQKPSKMLQGAEILDLRIRYRNHRFEVLRLIEKRVGAKIAITCYNDITPPEDTSGRLESAFVPYQKREKGAGRPTKKERRDMEDFRDKIDD